ELLVRAMTDDGGDDRREDRDEHDGDNDAEGDHRRAVTPQPLDAEPPRALALNLGGCLTFGDRSGRLHQCGSGISAGTHGCSLRPGADMFTPIPRYPGSRGAPPATR